MQVRSIQDWLEFLDSTLSRESDRQGRSWKQNTCLVKFRETDGKLVIHAEAHRKGKSESAEEVQEENYQKWNSVVLKIVSQFLFQTNLYSFSFLSKSDSHQIRIRLTVLRLVCFKVSTAGPAVPLLGT